MKIGIYQTFPKFGKIEENVHKVCHVLKSMDVDLIVLPELFNTGYQFISNEEVERLAEEVPQGFTTQTLHQMAKAKGCYIVAGLAEKDGFQIYNSAVLIGPPGHMATYRKSHLFFEEKLWFKPGNTGFKVYDIGAARIGMIVCFDWIFPEATRILALKGAQILCHPANLVFSLCQKTMIGRAIENRIFAATANRVGSEQRKSGKPLRFTGLSQIVDPDGNCLFQLSSEGEEVKVTEIDPNRALNKMLTEYNNLMKDRRVDLYKEIIN